MEDNNSIQHCIKVPSYGRQHEKFRPLQLVDEYDRNENGIFLFEIHRR